MPQNKTSFDSWLSWDEESSWCSGATLASLDSLEVVSDWEIKIPAEKKEAVWAQYRNKPLFTKKGMKDPSEIEVKTEGLWSMRPLYYLLGGGSFKAVGSTGIITQSSGAMKTFAFHMNMNGIERDISGCVMDEVTLNIPKEGGNLFWEFKAIGADCDYQNVAGTNPGYHANSLRTDDGTYTFVSGGNTLPDVFQGGKITFTNHVNTETPDLPNNRIYRPVVGYLEVKAEIDFRLDTGNTFLRAYENVLTGIFNLLFTIKNSDNTGIIIDISGLQIMDYTEPVKNPQEGGVVEQTITFEQSEDFSLKTIQVTGVDFS